MLSTSERAAGRWFRGRQQQLLDERNAASPPDRTPLPFLRHIRHLCPGAAGRSASFDYAEVAAPSPRIGVCYCSQIQEVPDGRLGVFPHEDCAGGALIEAGLFHFVYHEGRCAGCGLTARSTTGRVTDARERDPAGKVARPVSERR